MGQKSLFRSSPVSRLVIDFLGLPSISIRGKNTTANTTEELYLPIFLPYARIIYIPWTLHITLLIKRGYHTVIEFRNQ